MIHAARIAWLLRVNDSGGVSLRLGGWLGLTSQVGDWQWCEFELRCLSQTSTSTSPNPAAHWATSWLLIQMVYDSLWRPKVHKELERINSTKAQPKCSKTTTTIQRMDILMKKSTIVADSPPRNLSCYRITLQTQWTYLWVHCFLIQTAVFYSQLYVRFYFLVSNISNWIPAGCAADNFIISSYFRETRKGSSCATGSPSISSLLEQPDDIILEVYFEPSLSSIQGLTVL